LKGGDANLIVKVGLGLGASALTLFALKRLSQIRNFEISGII
jgi:hypothetical protein